MKFSIRDLFLVTMIVALAVAWWVDRSKLAKTVKRLQHDLGMRYTAVKSTWESSNSSAPAHKSREP